MRSWSKWVSFSRAGGGPAARVGPRDPALSDWSVSGRRTPPMVVRYAPDWARESRGSVGLAVGDTASGQFWSGGAGNARVRHEGLLEPRRRLRLIHRVLRGG